MTAERKRPGLNLDAFTPKQVTPTGNPEIAESVAKLTGFAHRHGSVEPEVPVKEVRIALNASEALRDWLVNEAHRQKTTYRTVILQALQKIGAPVSQEDLGDRRK